MDGIRGTVREELGALSAAPNLSGSDLERRRFIVRFGEQQRTDSNDLASRIDAEARLLNASLVPVLCIKALRPMTS